MKTQTHLKPTLKSLFISLAVLATTLASHAQSWTNYYGGPVGGDDYVKAIAVGSNGNVAVTGESVGSDWAIHYATIMYSNAGQPSWTNMFHGPGTFGDIPAGLVVDHGGSVIVNGYAWSPDGDTDFATIKYSPAGVPLWTNYYGYVAGGNDSPIIPKCIAVDAVDNVFVAGDSQAVAGDFYSWETAVIKYSSDGVSLWTNRFNALANAGHIFRGLAVDSNRNVIVTGNAYDNKFVERDYVIKYSGAGTPVWTNYVTKAAPQDVTVDDAGNVFVGCISATPPAGSAGFYIVKYSEAGVVQWTNTSYKGGRPDVDDWVVELAADGQGNVVVTGYLDSGVIPADAATLKYSGAGVPLWTNIYSGPADRQRYPRALALDGNGNAFVTGFPGSSPGGDFPTIKYSSGGVPLSTNSFPTSQGRSVGIAVDNSGNAFWTGYTWNGTNYDWVTIKYATDVASPTLNIQRLGNNFVLSWTDAAFGLQSAPAITGTFTNVPGATSPFTNAITGGGQRFFRLISN